MDANQPRKLKDLTPQQRNELVARVGRLKQAKRMGSSRVSTAVQIEQFQDPLPNRGKKF